MPVQEKAKVTSVQVFDLKYKSVICYNCGEPGHFVGLCSTPKCCFICSKPGHHMDSCPEWYKPLPSAQYLGSSNVGLGFFHVDVENPKAAKWLNFGNVGVIQILEGEASE